MTSSDSISTKARLLSLCLTGKRSKTSLVSDHFQQIEDLRSHGISYRQILEVLREDGLNLSLKTFESILHRLRNRQKKQSSRIPLSSQKTQTTQIEHGRELTNQKQEKPIFTPIDLKRLRALSYDIAKESIEDP